MEQESSTLKQQRDRRKRVGRIKTVALIALCVILTGCIFVNVVLMIKVTSLQEQIDLLAEVVDQRCSTSWSVASDEEDETTVVTVTPAVDNKSNVSEEDIDLSLDFEEEGVVNPARNRAEDGDKLQVYLTFDDGPSDNTDAILDILALDSHTT